MSRIPFNHSRKLLLHAVLGASILLAPAARAAGVLSSPEIAAPAASAFSSEVQAMMSREIAFNIPAGSAGAALAAFGAQSGLRLAPPPCLNSISTPVVTGEMPARQALGLLLNAASLDVIGLRDDGALVIGAVGGRVLPRACQPPLEISGIQPPRQNASPGN